MDDFYADFEWQPVANMPDGCNPVEVRHEDGRTYSCCSCDFWWMKKENRPTHFRHAPVA